ncbi:hypothetical protein G6F42_019599 [Rhizopus arrhizus]|nr:hypothetical protein G6F42_019599 [Rhizopus arrhizus]
MMHETNHFVRKFKTLKELADEQPNGIEEVRMVFKLQGTPDQQRCNSPTASEIDVLILGGGDDSDLERYSLEAEGGQKMDWQ